MERLTYDFCIAGKRYWQVKGADNLECSEVCRSRDDEGCNGCPIANAFDRLAAIEEILGDDYDLDRLKEMVVHGRWLNFYGDFTCAECSKCGAIYDVDNVKPSGELFGEFEKEYKFCPNCGAKMDLEE